MKIKWLIILAVTLIVVIFLAIFLSQVNTTIIAPSENKKVTFEHEVTIPDSPVVVVPLVMQKANRAITIIKVPEKNDEKKAGSTPNINASSSTLDTTNSTSAVSGSVIPEAPKAAGITKNGKEVAPEEIKAIKSKGIIIL